MTDSIHEGQPTNSYRQLAQSIETATKENPIFKYFRQKADESNIHNETKQLAARIGIQLRSSLQTLSSKINHLSLKEKNNQISQKNWKALRYEYEALRQQWIALKNTDAASGKSLKALNRQLMDLNKRIQSLQHSTRIEEEVLDSFPPEEMHEGEETESLHETMGSSANSVEMPLVLNIAT